MKELLTDQWSILDHWLVSKWKPLMLLILEAIDPIDILSMVKRSEKIVWHLGQHPPLNTTRTNGDLGFKKLHR